jgi:hypothetical protein
MSRSGVIGPGSLTSFTRHGVLNRNVTAPHRLKALFRLENQKHVRNDSQRERRYLFCPKCNTTTVTINFDQMPSARIGLWGRCVDGRDYTHHKFVGVSQADYMTLREMAPEERGSWWRFERE